MIHILHGQDILASRKHYKSLQKASSDPIVLEGANMKSEDVSQALGSPSLFANEQYIFIDEFLSKRKTGAETNAIRSYILNHHNDLHVVFWESKALTALQLKPFSGAQVTEFTPPSTVFQLLDALAPGKNRKLMSLYHTYLTSGDEQLVFYMLTRQIRLLLFFSEKPGDGVLDEVKRLAPWQRNKLVRQAGFFTIDHLQYLYSRLFTLDLLQKTGGLVCSLGLNIDFWLLEI